MRTLSPTIKQDAKNFGHRMMVVGAAEACDVGAALRNGKSSATQPRHLAFETSNDLAHQINNPLQGMMQALLLAGQGGKNAKVLARQALENLTRLSQLVNKLLVLPQGVTSRGRRLPDAYQERKSSGHQPVRVR